MVTAIKGAAAKITEPRDRAVVELALANAELLDGLRGVIGRDDEGNATVPDPSGYAKVAGELRQCLIELGLTPRSRAAILKAGGVTDDEGPDPLDELTARRRSRLD